MATPGSLALTPAGLFWSLVSAVTYAMYTLIPRRLMLHYGSVPVVAGALLIGGIIFSVVLQSWTVNPGFDFSGWLLLFFGLVLFGTIIGFTLYFQAVKDIGATKTALSPASKRFRQPCSRYCGWEPRFPGSTLSVLYSSWPRYSFLQSIPVTVTSKPKARLFRYSFRYSRA